MFVFIVFQFRYKRRVYTQTHLDEKQLSKLHTKVRPNSCALLSGWHLKGFSFVQPSKRSEWMYTDTKTCIKPSTVTWSIFPKCATWIFPHCSFPYSVWCYNATWSQKRSIEWMDGCSFWIYCEQFVSGRFCLSFVCLSFWDVWTSTLCIYWIVCE